MIEYLEQLVKEGKHQEALEFAEQLIRQVDNPSEILRIYVAQVQAHCLLDHYEAAFASGAVAKNLALGVEDWDAFGVTSVYLGVAYARLDQDQEAVNQIYDYLANLSKYTKASNLEHNAWYNLGIVRQKMNEPQESARALLKALNAAIRMGNHRFAHGVRQSLVGAYLQANLLESIPRLLAQCSNYLRNNRGMATFKKSFAIFVRLRGEYLIATRRPYRAQLVALRAADRVGGDPGCEMMIHYVLAKAAARLDNGTEALGHALAARTYAVAYNRSDLEAMASELLYGLTQTYSQGAEVVDEYYLRL